VRPSVFEVSINAFRLTWGRARKRAGLSDLHVHDLRHEAVSRLFERRLTATEVKSISGHRDARMLFRFAHPIRQRVLAVLDASDHR
jgi:integrase